MKFLFKISILLLVPFLAIANQKDSIYYHVFVGTTVSSYYTQSINLSASPFGYRFGFGVSKEEKNNFGFNSNIWFQNSSFTNIKTNFYDAFFKENVNLTTNINFTHLGFSLEANEKFSNFLIGLYAGITYLIKSTTTQDIEGGRGLTAINIYNTHAISGYQKDSFYNTINPFVGISLCYYPIKKLGIKYEANCDILANPSMGSQYFQEFHSIINAITLNYKFK
jgi:hypothetical protein